MLILLPPSETKAAPTRGAALDTDRLSMPQLNPMRATVLDALIAASDTPDALGVLGVGASLAPEVARNVQLRTAPARQVEKLYTGVLYDALDVPTLAGSALRRARRSIVVQSALFGALRLTDKVPAYRLSMGVNLPGVGPLASAWRPCLDTAMTAAAGHGVVVDCRSSTYAAAWTPTGDVADRWVRISVPGATHMAKHTRGLVARYLSCAAENPRTAAELADVLAGGFSTHLTAPPRSGRPWDLAVTKE